MPARILVIEDDDALTKLVSYNLRAAGYDVETAASAEDGRVLVKDQLFDLVVLDWMLPDMNGIEFLAGLRRSKEFQHLPVLMLTARGEEADRVRGLSTGADDYVVKPFSVPEFLARVQALLRRSSPERIANTLTALDITLDRDAHHVTRAGRDIKLGPTEYRLLEVLLENTGRVLSRGQLLDRVWGNTAEVDERTVDVHIGRLRKALIRGADADPIQTVRGAGYILSSQ